MIKQNNDNIHDYHNDNLFYHNDNNDKTKSTFVLWLWFGFTPGHQTTDIMDENNKAYPILTYHKNGTPSKHCRTNMVYNAWTFWEQTSVN